MSPELKEFVLAYSFKPKVSLTVKELVEGDNKINFQKLLKEDNHEVWRKCECGNEEDLRMTWTCSACGKVIFEPTNVNKE